MNDIADLDVIKLLQDLPEHGLTSGARGTIVGVYPDGYLVEFDDDNGETLAMVALYPDQIEVVWRMPRPAAVPE